MNVKDIEFEKPEGDMLELIFAKQQELMDKYHHIEERQGVGYGILGGRKFDINEVRSQCLIKDFAWRVTEEITEATECKLPDESEHFFEELADALHFITEMCITVGITPIDLMVGIITGKDDMLEGIIEGHFSNSDHIYDLCIEPLGLAMNCLKLKPWKTTHILTDVNKFRRYVIHAYRGLVKYMEVKGLSAEGIYEFYFKKQKVNKFRIRSNY